jgi:cytochrome c
MRFTRFLPAVLLALVPVSASAQPGDATKGRAVFARCAICHSVDPGVRKLGPSLSGVFGRKAGQVSGFAYSPAMKGSSIVWSSRTIDAFLADPRKAVPGNKMVFSGLTNAQDRANLIAYLSGATKPR